MIRDVRAGFSFVCGGINSGLLAGLLSRWVGVERGLL